MERVRLRGGLLANGTEADIDTSIRAPACHSWMVRLRVRGRNTLTCTHPCASYAACLFFSLSLSLHNTSMRTCGHILLIMLRPPPRASATFQRLDPHPHSVSPQARWAILDERVGLHIHWNIIWLRSDVRNLRHSLCRSGVHGPAPQRKEETGRWMRTA